MKGKFLGLFLVVALISLALASAADVAVSPSGLTFTQGINSTIFSVTNTNPLELLNINFVNPTLTGETSYIVSFNTPSGNAADINNSESSARQFTLTPTSAIDYSKFFLGKDYPQGSLTVKNAANLSDNQTIPINIEKSFCDSGNLGTNLSISSVDISNDGEGDEDTWDPLDDIQIDVTVDNNNPTDGDRIDTNVEVGLYDSSGEELLNLDRVKLGKITANNDKSTTFTFKVPSDLDDGSYRLYIKAYKSGSESGLCTSKFESSDFRVISIERYSEEDRQVMFDEVSFDNNPVECGQEVILKAKVANVGDSDQEKVKVSLYNKELGIDSYQVLSNLKQDTTAKQIEFTFSIPQNITEKTYKLELKSLYDFNDDHPATEDDAYDQSSESLIESLQVQGGCAPVITPAAATQITATLSSDAIAGQDLTILASIKNAGTQTQTYTLLVSGIENFATLVNIAPQTVTLEPGRAQDVVITLKANADAEGDYTFSIKALSGGNVKEQPVSVTIQAKSTPFAGFSSLFSNIQGNWLIWVIVLVNVVLIILIIIIAVRIARK